MRLHRLELTAFGPYPDTATVDFDELGADGLFLLYGDTGAGKTTILDGVAYALFGRVPGARQQAGRLRCDHAPPTAAPSVQLELTLAGRRLRVRRSPEWQRPKLRGEGVTREPAKALLEEWRDGGWLGLSTRVDEVSQQLGDWLGMSAEQFFQVVLLPQGEFARFLRAESTEREELLERLFGTKRFSDAEDWLAEQRRAARAEVGAVEERLRGLLARLCQAAGVPAGAEPELQSADEAWLGALSAEADASARRATGVAAASAVSLTTAQAELDRVAALRRRQERRLVAEQDRAKIDASRDEQDARLDEVAQARRAAPVRPLIAQWRSAVEQAQRAADALHSASAAIAAPAAVDLSDVEGLRRWSAALRDEVALLGAARADEDTLPDVERAVHEATRRLESLDAALGEHTVRRAALPGEVDAARVAVARAERAEERVPGLRDELGRAEVASSSARQHAVALARTARHRQGVVAAVDAHQQARETVLLLRQRRLEGIAAELAEGLAAGAPCPVCGGVEHPAPARPASGPVATELAEAEAASEEERCRCEREAAETALAEAQREEDRLATLAGGRPQAELDAEVASCAAALADATAIAGGLEAARLSLGSAESELAQAAEAERTLADQRAAVEGDVAQRTGALTALRARLDDARGDDPSLAARVERLSGLAERVDELREAQRVAADRAAAAGAAHDAAESEAARAGFDGLESAEAAALDSAGLAELEQACQRYDRDDAATAAALADPELAGLGELTAHTLVEVEPAEDAVAVARTVAAQQAVDARHAEHRRTEVAALARQLADAVAEVAPVRAQADRIAALADLVAGQGQNARRMTLRAYVLAARLDEVARCASERLRRMSGGRYSFVFSVDADSRRVRAGLGLRIVDDYSGQARSTKTLSGGESFMASLSLALGLADVVAAEAGGAPLETLFIDEGFGTLDADTLDLVMDTLDELRAGGRVIGLVSHVAEMRQRIPLRLRVRRVGASSRLELEAG